MGDLMRIFGKSRRRMSGEERQARAAYEAARRQLERRRQELDAKLDLDGLMEKMQEVREE